MLEALHGGIASQIAVVGIIGHGVVPLFPHVRSALFIGLCLRQQGFRLLDGHQTVDVGVDRLLCAVSLVNACVDGLLGWCGVEFRASSAVQQVANLGLRIDRYVRWDHVTPHRSQMVQGLFTQLGTSYAML